MLKGYHCGNAQHNVLFGTPVRKTDYLVPGIVIWNGLIGLGLLFGLLDLGLKFRLLAPEFDFKAKPCA
jgi:hypothetical protein